MKGPAPTTKRSPGQGGKRVQVRLSAAEHAAAEVEAKRLGYASIAEWMRALVPA